MILLVSLEHHELEKIKFKEENGCCCVTLIKSSYLSENLFSRL